MELEELSVSGTPRRMGEAQGEAWREAIQALAAIRMRRLRLIARACERRLSVEDVLGWVAPSLPVIAAFDPQGAAELAGIAQGAGIGEAELLVLQGFTDVIDLVVGGERPSGLGCTTMWAAPPRRESPVFAQTWDLYGEDLPSLRVLRRAPEDAPETVSLTVAGGLTMLGVNAEGLAVGTSNLHLNDAKPGVPYLSLLHRALRAPDAEAAAALIAAAPRMGGHSYSLCDAGGRALTLECSAERAVVHAPEDGLHAHTNHALSPELRELELLDPMAHSFARRERALACLSEGPLEFAQLVVILGDHAGGELCICRHGGDDDVRTNGCVVIEPARRTLHACLGLAHEGRWRSWSL